MFAEAEEVIDTMPASSLIKQPATNVNLIEVTQDGIVQLLEALHIDRSTLWRPTRIPTSNWRGT